MLMALVIPGQLIFMYTISFMKAGHTSITPIFVLMYLIAALSQVSFEHGFGGALECETIGLEMACHSLQSQNSRENLGFVEF